MICAVEGRPRHGKTYYVASMIPSWIGSILDEVEKTPKNSVYPQGENFPVSCIYSNVYLKFGVGSLKLIPGCDELACDKTTKIDDYGQEYFEFKHKDNCPVGNLWDDKDLWNPEKYIFYYRNIHEWNRFKRRGIIIADEGQRYMNARQWNMLSPDTEVKLQQGGKEDLDLWITVQDITRLDLVARQLIERFYHVETVRGNPDNKKKSWYMLPKKFQIDEYLYMDYDEGGHLRPNIDPISTETMVFKKRIGAIYNTRQKVGRSDYMPLRHVIRWCENDNCPDHGRKYGEPKVSHL